MKWPSKFFALLTATIAAAALGLAPPAAAELIDHHHDSGTIFFPGQDICGLEIDVTYSFVSNEQERISRTGFPLFASTGMNTTTLTNPDTGLSVTVRSAGASRDLSVVDNGDGTITVRTAVTGLPESFRGVNGKLIFQDRGRVVFATILDYQGTPTDTEDDIFVSDSIESASGPHPDLESGFELGCEVLIDQLT